MSRRRIESLWLWITMITWISSSSCFGGENNWLDPDAKWIVDTHNRGSWCNGAWKMLQFTNDRMVERATLKNERAKERERYIHPLVTSWIAKYFSTPRGRKLNAGAAKKRALWPPSQFHAVASAEQNAVVGNDRELCECGKKLESEEKGEWGERRARGQGLKTFGKDFGWRSFFQSVLIVRVSLFPNPRGIFRYFPPLMESLEGNN